MAVKKSQSSTYLVSLGLFVGLVFLSGEALVTYGVFSGLVMASGLVLSFWLLALFARHFAYSISALINRGRSPLDIRLLHGIGSLVKFELLIIEGLAIGRLGVFLFDVPFSRSIVIFYSLCLVIALLQRVWTKRKGSFRVLKLAVYFPLVILFPIYAFLQESPENVYHNLLHYSPWFLHLEHDGLRLLLPATALIGYGKLCLILLETHQALLLNSKKTLRRFGVAVSVWAAGILAFSATAIVAISEKIPLEQPGLLVIELIEKIGAPVILLVFCCSLLLMAVSTVVPLLMKLGLSFMNPFRTRSELTYGISIFAICLAAIVCTGWVESSGTSLLNLVLLFGVLDGPVGVMLTLISISERLKAGNWSIWGYPAIACIIVFFCGNWLRTPYYGVGVLLSCGFTLILMGIHMVWLDLFRFRAEKTR